jgi:Fuc2NAc and GlcNAc transferase
VEGDAVWLSAVCLLSSAILTFLARKLALARNLVDVPTVRSSHQVSTPRGGGAAVALVTTAALMLRHESLPSGLLLALAGGGLAVALVGYADDHRSLPSWVRLIVHFGAAVWALSWLGGMPPLRFGGYVTPVGWFGNLVAVLGIVWVTNLFNFMDGIDGIAASEAVFVALAGAWLTAGGNPGLAPVSLALAAACCGFLLWNWPPAKIFLGDVGSGYLGYVIAVLALSAARSNTVALWVWLILGGVFFVDATVTLARRVLRGERVSEPHRAHAYQWLARRWGGHAKVTIACLALNLVWLLPCAVLATRRPDAAPLLVLCAFVPLVSLALLAGAGRRQSR